jgi:hypothetical protein
MTVRSGSIFADCMQKLQRPLPASRMVSWES